MVDAARKRWPKAIWIEGRGKWASVSSCPPGTTVVLFPTKAEAEAAKRVIDCSDCGGGCMRMHSVVCLRENAA